MAKKKGLGKGLDVLLGGASLGSKSNPVADSGSSVINLEEQSVRPAKAPGSAEAGLTSVDSSPVESAPVDNILKEIPVGQCQKGQYQPRREIEPSALDDLAASIKAQGVMQPIVVRPLTHSPDGVAYEIIAGERRWRAAQLAGLETVPAVVRVVSDEAAIAMALIENLQREDLNPMEEAYAMHRLQQEFELTHQQVADAVGKSRAAVSNLLRLMGLQKEVKLMLENGDLEMGHARALLTLDADAQVNMAREVVNKALSVRQTELLVRKQQQGPDKVVKKQPEEPNIARLRNDLSEKLGVPVLLQHSASGKGKLVLKYNSLDELDGILDHIK